MYTAISILFGVVPEAIFLALLFIMAKDIRSKRLALCAGFIVANVTLSTLLLFSVWLHIAVFAGLYIVAKAICDAELSDVFVLACGVMIIAITSVICYFGIPNYWIAFVTNRILLFIILILARKQCNPAYSKYRHLWNRRDDGKIKSITLRNISLISLNLLLYAAALILSYWGQNCVWR